MNSFVEELFTTSGMAPSTAHMLAPLTLLLSLSLLALCCGWICTRFLMPAILKLVSKTSTRLDDYFVNVPVLRGLSHIVPGIIFYIFLPYCFPETQPGADSPLLHMVLLVAVKIYITITTVMLVTAFLTNLNTFTTEQDKARNHHIVGILQFLKLICYCMGGIVVIAFLFNRSPLNLIAGLGAVATVLMLVFRDSILGLVAGIQLSANRMLKPGDWVTIKKLGIDGFVEEVSLTTVKIRNFDNTISTVPPYTLVSDSFQNWSNMFQVQARRFKRSLYIDVNSIRICSKEELGMLRRDKLITKEEAEEPDAVNLTLFRHYAERHLRSNPLVRDDKWLMARQLESTPQGLPVELFFYFKETDFVKYEQLSAETVERLIAVLPRFGLRLFQAPSGHDISKSLTYAK